MIQFEIVTHIDREGKSRKFGFVGFKSTSEAKRAIKHFNQTFIDTSRVTVESAQPVLFIRSESNDQVGDGELIRPWSRHSQGSSAFVKKMKAREARRGKIEEVPKEKKVRDSQVTYRRENDQIQNNFLQMKQIKTNWNSF